jgi:hypothetical protein
LKVNTTNVTVFTELTVLFKYTQLEHANNILLYLHYLQYPFHVYHTTSLDVGNSVVLVLGTVQNDTVQLLHILVQSVQFNENLVMHNYIQLSCSRESIIKHVRYSIIIATSNTISNMLLYKCSITTTANPKHL